MRSQLFKSTLLAILIINAGNIWAQTDTTESTEDYEDYSIYDNLEFADVGAKRFANVKVSGKSPDKLISIGYDYQGSYDMDAAAFGGFPASSRKVNSTHGVRLEANIPIISKNSIIVQGGFSYWNFQYDFENSDNFTNPLHAYLHENGLNVLGLSVSIYKPINENTFILGRIAGTMAGDYEIGELQPMNYTRYAVAAVYGKKPNDYKQWGFGLSRTYRAGELNYIPVFLYNWTATSRKWGIETLFPAYGDVRYNFSPRSMLFFGFDLEGASTRLGNDQELAEPYDDLELRRAELRFRFRYERKITGFLWVSAKVGYRYNYSFNVDRVKDGEDFFRGFFGDQDYVMENELTNPLFFNVSLNLVSP